jgi:hypothetical protein
MLPLMAAACSRRCLRSHRSRIRRVDHARVEISYHCAYTAPLGACKDADMASKKRKTARKSATKPKAAKKRRTAAKRASGGRRKGLVMDMVHTLEEIPAKLRKAAKKTRKVAAKSKVVRKLEEIPKTIRKAAKKTGWRT